MLKPETIRELLADANLSAVSRASGVSYDTVRTLAKSENDPPVTYASYKRVSDYLESKLNG